METTFVKTLRTLILVAGALAALPAWAQLPPIQVSSQTYQPLVGATVLSGFTDSFGSSNLDDGELTVTLPFGFAYFGTTYTSVSVGTNGYLAFGLTGVTAGFDSRNNQTFPAAATPNGLIAPFWDDMEIASGVTQVRMLVEPSRVIFEFYQLQGYFASGEFASFQIALYAGGLFTVHYGPMASGSSWTFSSGFENQSGTVGANFISGCTTSCSIGNWTANTLIRVGEPDVVDLTVPTVTVANMVRQSDDNLTFTVNARIQNIGRTATDAGFDWQAYLSLDRTLNPDAGDILVASGSVTDLLPAVFGGVTADGGLSIVDVSGSAVTSTPPPTGDYYVLVVADPGNAITENSEANNVGSTASSFAQGIDLVAQSISGGAASSPGYDAGVSITFYNRGTSAPSSAVPFRVLLSGDATYDTSDVPIYDGSATVSGGETITRDVSFTMPPNAAQGTYYYLLQVDPTSAAQPTGVVVESSETNNVVASSGKVTISRPELSVASASMLDPTTGQPTTRVNLGDAVRVTARVVNDGDVPAFDFDLGLVLSRDSTLTLLSDTKVCESHVDALPVSTTGIDVTFDCTMALNDRTGAPLESGQYFFFVLADSNSAVPEQNELNNSVVFGPIAARTPAPDLVVSLVSAPTVAGVGEVIPVVRGLRNQGNVDAPQVSYRYFASANAIVTAQDVPLTIMENGAEVLEKTVTLARGGSDLQTELVKLPAGMSPGTYYVGCIIDTGNAVPGDWDGSNNAAASQPVQVAGSALRVATTTLPDAVVGLPYAFRLTALAEEGPSTWSLDSTFGPPPAWLSLDASTGLLSGTPTGEAGLVALTIAVDNGGRTALTRLALRVLPMTSGLIITSSALPALVSGAAYSYTLGAAGGVPPYSWRLLTGTLPAGLTLSSAGLLAGQPPSAPLVAVPLTVQVRDAVGATASRALSLRVIAPGAISFTTLALPDAVVGQSYLADIRAQNQDGSSTVKPLLWTVTGALPAGVTATPQQDVISLAGAPREAGRFTFTVSVEDGNGRTDSIDYTLTVQPQRYRVLATLPDSVRVGETVDVPLAVSPAAAVTYRVVNGTLPPGITLADGKLSGTVAEGAASGLWPFMLEARDGAGMTGVTPLAFSVAAEVKSQGCSSTPGGLTPLVLVLALLAFSRRRAQTFAALAVVALVPFAARAQYSTSSSPAAYAPLTNGTATTAGASIIVPFDFQFFNTVLAANQPVQMSQYGYLAVAASSSSSSSNLAIPNSSTSGPKAFIAPWWDQLTTPASSANGYRYQLTGSAPNRVMSFEWNQVGANVATNRIAFQIQLYEATGRIRFIYSNALPATGVSASVGIQGDLGVGVAGMSCAPTCASTVYPAGQSIDFFRPPDFELVSVSSSQTGYAGVSFLATATVRNSGGRDATSVPVRFFLSDDQALDTATDAVIGTAQVPSLVAPGVGQATSTAALPATLTPGSVWYVFAVVDPDGLTAETLETNNTSLPTMITIGSPTPDLTVNSVSAPDAGAPGEAISVTAVFANQGNADSTATSYSWFLSDNASVSVGDRALGVGSLAAITAHQTQMVTDSLTLPAGLAPGRYWVGVCVNYDSSTSQFGGPEISIVNDCFTRSQSVTVSTGSVAISAAPLPSATQFSPYGLRLVATGGSGTYAWQLTGGALPPGLSLSAAGDLAGAPSSVGTFTFDVTVTSGPTTDTRSLSIGVVAGGLPLAVVPQSLTAAEAGRVYKTPLVAVGGKPPYAWALVDAEASPLPVGIGLSTDGLLEGRAQAQGDYAFTVRVTDSDGATADGALSLSVVTPVSLSVGTVAMKPATLGAAYLQPLVAVGGLAPYTWSVVRFQKLAELPTDVPGAALTERADIDAALTALGLEVDDRVASDYFSGTPVEAGLFLLTFEVEDSSGTSAAQSITDTANVLLRVAYRDGLAITTTALPDAFVNQPYQVKLSHNGGVAAEGISFSVACVQQVVRPGEFKCADTDVLQQLPAGLTLATDGTISGSTTAEPGVYTFLVKVVDQASRQDVRASAIRVQPDFATQSKSGCSTTPVTSLSWLGALVAFALWRRRASSLTSTKETL